MYTGNNLDNYIGQRKIYIDVAGKASYKLSNLTYLNLRLVSKKKHDKTQNLLLLSLKFHPIYPGIHKDPSIGAQT